MLLWNIVEHPVNPKWFPIRKLRLDRCCSYLHQWSFEQWIVLSRFSTQPVTRKRMHCNCFIPLQFKLHSI